MAPGKAAQRQECKWQHRLPPQAVVGGHGVAQKLFVFGQSRIAQIGTEVKMDENCQTAKKSPSTKFFSTFSNGSALIASFRVSYLELNEYKNICVFRIVLQVNFAKSCPRRVKPPFGRDDVKNQPSNLVRKRRHGFRSRVAARVVVSFWRAGARAQAPFSLLRLETRRPALHTLRSGQGYSFVKATSRCGRDWFASAISQADTGLMPPP